MTEKIKYKRKCESCRRYFLVHSGYSSNRIYCDGCKNFMSKHKVDS